MSDRGEQFKRLVLPHLDSAYNLARWLCGSAADADDLVQEAMLRAFRAWPDFRGGDARCWLLTIVRNACYSFMSQSKRQSTTPLTDSISDELPAASADPADAMISESQVKALWGAVDALPPEFREIFILREQEDLSYGEISKVTGVPIGTVMSRLSRARKRLQAAIKGTCVETDRD